MTEDAYIYVREVGSDPAERDLMLVKQVCDLEERCEKMRRNVAGTYIDRIGDSVTDSRAQFRAMLDDALAGKHDVTVIALKKQPLFRNMFLSEATMRVLEGKGVRLSTDGESSHTGELDPFSPAFLSVLEEWQEREEAKHSLDLCQFKCLNKHRRSQHSEVVLGRR